MNLPSFKKLVEEIIPDKLPGGVGDDSDPSEFDQKELMKGIHVELEHTDDIMTAIEIALDHLSEDSIYYTNLEKVHKD